MRYLGVIALTGCTALLGDFNVGSNTDGGPDGSPDGMVGDGAVEGDVSAPPPVLKCSVNLGDKLQLIDGIHFDEHMAMFVTGKDTVRVFVEAQDTVYVLQGQVGGKPWSFQTIAQSLNGQLLTLARGPGTTVALHTYYKTTSNFAVTRWDDSTNIATSPYLLTADGSISSNELAGTILPIAPTSNDYYVVGQWSVGTSSDFTLQAAHVKGGTAVWKPVIGTMADRMDLGPNSLAMVGPNTYMLVGPGGPTVGGSRLFKMDSNDGHYIGTRDLLPSGGSNFISLGMNLQHDPGAPRNGMVFLEGDIVGGTTPPEMRVGAIDDTAMNTFETKDLPKTDLKTINDVPVDKGRCEWTPFPAPFGPQLVCVARAPSQPPVGANMLWWNAAGQTRALAIGPDQLLKGMPIDGVALTFFGTPNALFADFGIAWLEAYKDITNQTDLHRVWFTTGSCQK